MEINGRDPSIQLDAYTRKTQEKLELHASEAAADPKVSGGDKVVLSPRAKEIQEATQKLQSIPDVDEQQVERIQSRIDQQVYRIQGGQIAEKMLKEMMEASAFLSA